MAKFLARSVNKKNTGEAVKELKEKFFGFPVATLLFFASHEHDGALVAALMRDAFPQALTFGCSSYAEMGEGRFQYGSITAMAFSADVFESIQVTVVESITTNPLAVNEAFAELEKQNGYCKAMEFDYRNSFGMMLFDGRKVKIEEMLGRIGNITDVTFIGGYASDDFSLSNIHVFFDGKSYEDAAVLAILKPTMPFQLLKTQSAVPLGPIFVAGKIMDDGLTVREFNGRPAAEAFAEGIGVDVSELNEDLFTSYSFGLMANEEPFVRSGRCFNQDGGISFFCRIGEGQHVRLMKTGDVVAATADALEEVRKKLGTISAVIDFDCAHRALMLEASKSTGQYADLFKGIEAVALATFCEVYIANINQSSVMAIFA